MVIGLGPLSFTIQHYSWKTTLEDEDTNDFETVAQPLEHRADADADADGVGTANNKAMHSLDHSTEHGEQYSLHTRRTRPPACANSDPDHPCHPRKSGGLDTPAQRWLIARPDWR